MLKGRSLYDRTAIKCRLFILDYTAVSCQLYSLSGSVKCSQMFKGSLFIIVRSFNRLVKIFADAKGSLFTMYNSQLPALFP